MGSNPTAIIPTHKIQCFTGLYVRFFKKELFLSPAELGGAQYVEARATDFIIATIENEWGLPVQYETAIEENDVRGLTKLVRIQVFSAYGKIPQAMAKLETHIGYSHPENNRKIYRNHTHSATPLEPDALHISYTQSDISQPFTDFQFNHEYSGVNLFGNGRSTYSVYLRFPEGYFDPQEQQENGKCRSEHNLLHTDGWRLKSIQDKLRYLRTAEESALPPTVAFHKSTIPSIHAIVPYREWAFGKIQPERLPVLGGAFPIVFVEGKTGKPTSVNHQEVIRYETEQGEEIEVMWAEIQRNNQAITPRFLHLSYEVIDALINQAMDADDDPDSLKAILYHSDGQTVCYGMKLQVWTPE